MAVVESPNTITGQGRTSFQDSVKDEYVPAWEDHVHTGIKIASKIAKKKGTMGGKRTLTSVMDSYPQSAGIALFENDDMPTPRVGTYFQPELYSRRIFSRLRWTWEVQIQARKGDSVAWRQPRANDLRTARIQFDINFSRMLYLGPAQILATQNGAVSSATSTVFGRDTRSSANDDRHKYGLHYLRKNMSITHVAASAGAVVPYGNPADANSDATTGAFVNERYISSMSKSALTFTMDQVFDFGTASALPANESIFIPFRSRLDGAVAAGSATNDSVFAGPNGLMNMVANYDRRNTLYSVDRSSYPTLEAYIDANSGVRRPWNEHRIALAVDTVNDGGTGDDVSDLIMNRSMRREYVRETAGQRQFDPVLKTKGYAPKLTFQAGDVLLPIMTDRDCPPGLVWAIEADGFGWLSEADLQQIDDGDRFVANKAGHEMLLGKSGNVFTKKPHNNALIEDISDATESLVEV